MHNYLHIGRASDLTTPSDRRLYRFLEIFPGLLAWASLIAIVVAAKFAPTFAAIFIIAFDVYWLLKTIYLSVHMNATFRKMRGHMKRDWLTELQSVTPNSEDLIGSSWKDIYHLVVLPFANEPLEVVRESIRSLTKISYPLDRVAVVLGTEKRMGASALDIAHQVQAEFGSLFHSFLITTHPDDLPNEMAGKGSNAAWAGEQAKKKIIDRLGIPYKHIVVSIFDIDTIVPPQFFACLTWHYLISPKPLRSSFQPIPIFTNNIWEAPAFARVFAFSTTFWQMIQQARPEQLVNFSSQSLGFQALVDVGFWQRNMVSEDSRIFWQCFLRYDGDWRAIPLYYPVYMDANVAPTFWQTIRNQYKQIRRWLYGAENNPYFLFGFIKNKLIPRNVKWWLGFNIIEKTHSSATNALIIFALGWLPTAIGNGNFSHTVLSYNLPDITRIIMIIAMFGLVSSAIISVILLPPRPPNYGKYKWVWMILQWFLFPINFIFFGAVPALDAQTRLMLGKYMGFWVTPKQRRS